MMKEFQAENDQRQPTVDNNLTVLINAAADHLNVSSNSNDQTKFSSSSVPHKQESCNSDSTHSKPNTNKSDLRTVIDKNKLNNKTTNRSSSDALKVRISVMLTFLYLFYFRLSELQHMI